VVSDPWRFPTESCGGECTRRALLGPFGFLGDRHHALMNPVDETERCAVTTLDHGTRVLATIARERENVFGTDCRVVRGGWVVTGDRVMIDPVPRPAT